MRKTMSMVVLVLAGGVLSGCGLDEGQSPEGAAGEESRAAQAKLGGGRETFLYFRCGATGWGVDEATRLVPAPVAGRFTITYEVTETWMTTGWDHCTVVQTNQLDGWGTQQRFYDKVGNQLLSVPAVGAGNGRLALAAPGVDYHFYVRYPARGSYTMTLSWVEKTLSIERSHGSGAGWLWPVPGDDGEGWVINNYVDLDASAGLRDYRGGTKTYDGHQGTDIDLPTFRQMDQGHPVIAASAGTVVGLADGNADRNTTCMGAWNYVTVATDDGYRVTYGHLKRNSIVVSVGQHVEAGATLAMVGSSGCSTWPHLHFEVADANGAIVDPFVLGLWASPPTYEPPLSVMDLVVADHEIVSTDGIADPGPNATEVVRGGWLAVGISAAGGTVGDSLFIEVLDANGATYQLAEIPMPEAARHTVWYFNWILDSGAPAGTWTVSIRANETLAISYSVQVR